MGRKLISSESIVRNQSLIPLLTPDCVATTPSATPTTRMNGACTPVPPLLLLDRHTPWYPWQRKADNSGSSAGNTLPRTSPTFCITETSGVLASRIIHGQRSRSGKVLRPGPDIGWPSGNSTSSCSAGFRIQGSRVSHFDLDARPGRARGSPFFCMIGR